MMTLRQCFVALTCLILTFIAAAHAAAADKVVVGFKPDTDVSQFKTDHASVQIVKTEGGSGLELKTDADVDYPGVHLVKPGTTIDLSGFTGIEALLTNTSDAKQSISLRADNPGDWKTNPWNGEVIHGVAPGQTVKLRLTFGQSWGHPGFKLDPSKIKDILVFTNKSSAPRTLIIHQITAVTGAASGNTASAAPAASAAPVAAVEVKGKDLIDVTSKDVAAQFVPSSDQLSVTATPEGLVVNIKAGPEGYPGVKLKPQGAAVWNLSAYGHINAKVTNTGSKDMLVAIRVDNDGDWKASPWNTEQTYVKPGASATINLIFGHAYGHKPGYQLKTNAVSQIMFFTGKIKEDVSFRIDSLEVGGPAGETPPVDPKSIRIKPENTYLFGNNLKFEPDKQLEAKDGATAALNGNQIQIDFAADKPKAVVFVRPPIGKWDLVGTMEVHVKVKNVGKSPITPRVCIAANGGDTQWGETKTLAPGQSAVAVTSFIGSSIWNGADERKTGNRAESDTVAAIRIASKESTAGSLLVESIRAVMPVANVPAWLGKRPPVEGDWTMTFEDNFDKPVDYKVWNIYTHNYWDKRSHITKDNLIIENGEAHIRYSKTTGNDWDDPAGKQTDYAVGYLDTYGKWVQRYGYFEARVKLPDADGLWPAFWMMPDRGADVGPQWKRSDTANGGMEFDIMEHLSRWRNGRYNIAFHYDGYGKNHKATGSSNIYVVPDKDGYITAGLLWLPGQAVIYANGLEVARWESDRISNVPSYPILYMVSGGWANNGINDKQLPVDFVVDYIRCWQRKDLASEADGFKKPQSKWELGSWSPIDSRLPPKEEPKPAE